MKTEDQIIKEIKNLALEREKFRTKADKEVNFSKSIDYRNIVNINQSKINALAWVLDK